MNHERTDAPARDNTDRAIRHMEGKGRLTYGELRQVGGEVPGIVATVAEALGKTPGDAIEEIQTGGVSAESALPVIRAAVDAWRAFGR